MLQKRLNENNKKNGNVHNKQQNDNKVYDYSKNGFSKATATNYKLGKVMFASIASYLEHV